MAASDADSINREERALALAAAGVLGAGIAHELRNTLAAAESAIYLARRDAADPKRLLHHLDRAEAEIRTSQDVIDRVLGLARGEPVRRELAPLAVIATNALRELGETRARVEVVVTPPELEALCDPILLERVLVNLLRNADEALAARGSGHVEVRASATEKGVLLEVSDDGPGLDPAVAARVFEPLVTDKPTGTGLGLALCRVIVRAHGGTIEATRSPSGGALFRLVLPSMG